MKRFREEEEAAENYSLKKGAAQKLAGSLDLASEEEVKASAHLSQFFLGSHDIGAGTAFVTTQ